MKTGPVSFGRMLKINAPLNVTQRMADIINQDKSVQDKKERKVQQELKSIFYDTNIGNAQAVDVNGVSYIFSGDDSLCLSDVEKERDELISHFKECYCHNKDRAKKEEDKQIERFETYKRILVDCLNPDKISITPYYRFIPKTIDLSKDEIRIKSINVIL
ncbi:MAG: hypothetical protein IJY61_08695 [Candidatus Gastranaerophilales bacterium]|nr:hypothetical protein [Candidatus Gastranaerophilales bacterium]